MTSRLPRYLVVIILVILVILYIPFHNRYRTDYVDDAWSFSWARNLVVDGEVYDPVFGYLDGDGGTSLFGRTYAYVYGVWGLMTNWSRSAGYVLSVMFLLGSAVLWRKNLIILGYTPVLAWAFLMLMLLMEIYFGIGHGLRGDAMVFFLATLTFTLFLVKRPFFSALVLCLAVESHPYGMAGLFYIFAFLIAGWLNSSREKRRDVLSVKTVVLFVLGGIAGIAYYLALHYPWLGGLADLSGRTGESPIAKYFFQHRYSWRHWPELLMIAVGTIVFLIRREYRNDRFIPVFMILMLVFSLALPRGNYHYVVFLYPPFLLLLLYLATRLNILVLFMAGFLLFQIPQYAWLFWSQRSFSWQSHMENLKAVIPDGEQVFVYGPSSSWFALMDRDFHAYGYFGRAGDLAVDPPESLYVISNGNLETENGKGDLDILDELYDKTDIKIWDEPGHSAYSVVLWQKKR